MAVERRQGYISANDTTSKGNEDILTELVTDTAWSNYEVLDCLFQPFDDCTLIVNGEDELELVAEHGVEFREKDGDKINSLAVKESGIDYCLICRIRGVKTTQD